MEKTGLFPKGSYISAKKLVSGCNAENLIHRNSEPAIEAILLRRQNAAAPGISRANERASSGGTHDSCPAGFPVHRRNIRSLVRGDLCDVVSRQVAAQLLSFIRIGATRRNVTANSRDVGLRRSSA